MSQKNDTLIEISGKLDKVIKLLALNVVKGYDKELEKIELLDSLGFRPIEIASFLNKSQDNVNNRLNEIRNKKELNSKKERKENKDNKKSENQQLKSQESA